MSKVIAKLLFFVIIFPISNQSVFASDNPSTGSAVVSATVIGSSIGPPILIAPYDNSATNNPREPLVWTRPSPLPSTPIHHYDVFLDGAMFASTVSDSITTQNYYFYSITRIGDTFHLYFNTDLTDGYHTWKVIVYDNNGINSSSETRTYYIDSSIPILTLKKVDHQTLGWTTADLTTIPPADQRFLTITTADPLLSGTVEAYVNMQIMLVCPTNILDCTDQFYQGPNETGTWKHRFYNLIPDEIYTVYIAATDAGSNSVALPEFYLIYGTVTPSPTITPTPSLIPTPTLEEVVPTASPSGEILPTPPIITPTPEVEVPFTPVPPPAPAPPIFQTATPIENLPAGQAGLKLIIILLVLGLPLHLFMTVYGTKTRFTLIPKLLFVLFFPFLDKKDYQTVPFTTIEMFDPDKLDSSWQTKISDIRGFYSLTSPLINKVFIKISCQGRYWKNVILSGILLPQICLFPILETPQTPSNRLRRRFMTYRSVPLGVACLTSGVALVLQPNYFFLIYLYLSLQLVFSEYLYPRLSK